jgi:inositol-hexakisphosphate kinase
MIDFAHSTYLGIQDEKTVHNGPDTGYLFGLRHLIDLFTEIKQVG